jgi:hypothetical protein
MEQHFAQFWVKLIEGSSEKVNKIIIWQIIIEEISKKKIMEAFIMLKMTSYRYLPHLIFWYLCKHFEYIFPLNEN